MKIINNSLGRSFIRDRKGKAPPVGVEPNASHLPNEHPRPLDHRGFPDLSPITHPSDLSMVM